MEASTREAFQPIIRKAWEKVLGIYFKESGLKVGSDEWTFINEQRRPRQAIEVIAQSTTTALESTRKAKKTGFRATFNRAIGRKETGKILVRLSATQIWIVNNTVLDFCHGLQSLPLNLIFV
jgi:hypothetical protein